MTSCPSRCPACNSVIAKTDIDCYVCGEPVPGRKHPWSWFHSKPAASLTDRIQNRDEAQAHAGAVPASHR